MGKKKNKPKNVNQNDVFNKVDAAFDAMEDIGENANTRKETVISGKSEPPMAKTEVPKPEQHAVENEPSLAVDTIGETIPPILDKKELEIASLQGKLRDIISTGTSITESLKKSVGVSKEGKAAVSAYERKPGMLDTMSFGDAMRIGLMAEYIPAKIKEIKNILDNPATPVKEKLALKSKLADLEKEYQIMKLKKDIVGEEFKLYQLALAQEKENNRKEEAKAQLEELRIKYGDELIKSLIA